MTKEEAINVLKTDGCYDCTFGCFSPFDCKNDLCDVKEATQMAIKALEEPPQLYGYSLDELIAFATACRRAGVNESDMRTFATNCRTAWEIMEQEFRQSIEDGLKKAIGKGSNK